MPDITLIEEPGRFRFLCDDGQVLDVVAHNQSAARDAALAYFEQHTTVAKPTKSSQVWVRIEGTAVVYPPTVESPQRAARTKR